MSRWGKKWHFVFAFNEWHQCPMDCGGMCDWRPTVKLEVVR